MQIPEECSLAIGSVKCHTLNIKYIYDELYARDIGRLRIKI